MTLTIDIPDVPDSQGPAPPPYTPYATEAESTVLSNAHHTNTARHRSVRNANGHAHAHPSQNSTPRPSPQRQLTVRNPSSPTVSENAQAGPSRPRQSSIEKPRPRATFPVEQNGVSSLPTPVQAPHTPPRPEDLRDRGRSNNAWRQYLQGLPVNGGPSNGPDIGNLSLEDKSNKPLPPTPPPLPSRSPRPPPPVPPPPSRLDPRSRQPPPPPLQSTPPRPAPAPVPAPPVSTPVSFPAPRPVQQRLGPHDYEEMPRPQRHSAPVVQPPVHYVHEVPQAVQRVYQVPVQRVYEVPVQGVQHVPYQQAPQTQPPQPTPLRQVHHSVSVPQFAHPDSRHLVRPLDSRQSEPELPRRRLNSTPNAGPSGMAFQHIGLPPSIPERRTSLPEQGPPTPPKPSAASEFPPPILRTGPKPPAADAAICPPPPRHIVARGGTPSRSPQRNGTRTPRRTPSVIDLTQDTSPSSAGSPPKATRTPRAQSDVGRPSPRTAGNAVSAPSAASRSAVGPSTSRSVVSAPSSTPKRKPSSSVVSSPASPTSPSKVRCSGYTRSGDRCKRLVKAGAPGAALLDNDERYCKDHAGLLLKPNGFYSRRSPGDQGTWVEFKTYIPRALGEQTQALLRTTMEASLTASETPGFLYVYELRGMGAPSTSFFKVGRSDCVPRRIGQWAAQCSSHAPVLRDVFPLADGGSTLPGAMRNAGQMAAASKRWERLVHLELADRAAAERPLAYRSLEGKCADCGAVHREIFPLASSEGYAVVVEAITRWEKFVRAIA